MATGKGAQCVCLHGPLNAAEDMTASPDSLCSSSHNGSNFFTCRCAPTQPGVGETGVSPVLPRNCERGRNLREATGRTAGKAQGVGRSVSQETWSRHLQHHPFAGRECMSCG